MDNINELLIEDKFININDELKSKGFKKIAVNLSQIDDDEYISIDYNGDSFSYQLPFTINIENTKKQIKNIVFSDDERIEVENIEIFENGLIKGHDFETYEDALNAFMEVLPKLRRNI